MDMRGAKTLVQHRGGVGVLQQGRGCGAAIRHRSYYRSDGHVDVQEACIQHGPAMLEYGRLRSSHVVYICITIRSILTGVASEPRGETAARPRPSRGVGRLRPLDSDTYISDRVDLCPSSDGFKSFVYTIATLKKIPSVSTKIRPSFCKPLQSRTCHESPGEGR